MDGHIVLHPILYFGLTLCVCLSMFALREAWIVPPYSRFVQAEVPKWSLLNNGHGTLLVVIVYVLDIH